MKENTYGLEFETIFVDSASHDARQYPLVFNEQHTAHDITQKMVRASERMIDNTNSRLFRLRYGVICSLFLNKRTASRLLDQCSESNDPRNIGIYAVRRKLSIDTSLADTHQTSVKRRFSRAAGFAQDVALNSAMNAKKSACSFRSDIS